MYAGVSLERRKSPVMAAPPLHCTPDPGMYQSYSGALSLTTTFSLPPLPEGISVSAWEGSASLPPLSPFRSHLRPRQRRLRLRPAAQLPLAPDDERRLLSAATLARFGADRTPPRDSRGMGGRERGSPSGFSDGGLLAPHGPKNRAKAVLTVLPPHCKILMANDTAVKLLGLTSEELVGRTLSSLCRDADAQGGLHSGTISGSFLDIPSSELTTKEGDLVPVYGKIVDVRGSGEATTPVSLWVYPLRRPAAAAFTESLPAAGFRAARDEPTDGRFLVVMEPVSRLRGELTLGPKGRVFSADAACGRMFGVHCESLLLGVKLQELLPKLSPETLASAKAPLSFALSGRRQDSGDAFPLTGRLVPDVDEEGEVLKYTVELDMVETISGVVSLSPDAAIRSFHTQFVNALTGYTMGDVDRRHVSSLIPDFAVRAPAAVVSAPCSPAVKGCSEDASTSAASTPVAELAARLSDVRVSPNKPNLPPHATNGLRLLIPPLGGAAAPLEGVHKGHARHADGSLIPISYHLRRLQAADSTQHPHYCLWVLWQMEPQPMPPSPITPSADKELKSAGLDMWVGEESLGETCDALLGSGAYADAYRTLSQIGKGAFGAVKLAVRRSDDLLVVTKFVCKVKVLSGSWIESPGWEHSVPIELHLLRTLSHPNIVSVIDVFENADYYQLVMERHGSGMDLFEFIDREPKLDEALVSFIFRQLVSAVAYLDAKGIVHRDMKDENIIIDEAFRVKLIDFGSAAFYSAAGPAFSTFCGTIEYASPEILLGNRYRGPEAEVWSLGVLLFTLEFGEAPFQSPEETIEAAFVDLWEVSEGLDHLLGWMLHPAPESRATVKEVERHYFLLQPFNLAQYSFKAVLSNAEPEEVRPVKYLNGRCPKGSETGSE